MDSINWPMIINSVVPIVASIVFAVVGYAINKWLAVDGREKHRKLIYTLAESAYYVVEQIARKTPSGVDDKLAMALKQMANSLGKPLSPQDQSMAELALRSWHEQEKSWERFPSSSLKLENKEIVDTQIKE